MTSGAEAAAVLRAEFLAEARDLAGLPPPGPAEIAIAGRSNVGKSTLLNRLVGRRSLARTSKTPGRTRGLIFYDLGVRAPAGGAPAALRLVDLPGYGYAQVSQAERKAWQTLVEGYVEGRPTLRLFLVLVDARRGVEDEERQLVEWLVSLGVPHRLAVTKIDKLGSAERGAARARVRAAFPPPVPAVSAVSGETGEGVDALRAILLGHAGLV